MTGPLSDARLDQIRASVEAPMAFAHAFGTPQLSSDVAISDLLAEINRLRAANAQLAQAITVAILAERERIAAALDTMAANVDEHSTGVYGDGLRDGYDLGAKLARGVL